MLHDAIIDLFCGAGGFSRGFHQEGFRTILAIDADPNPMETFQYNFPKAICWKKDIKTVHGIDILRRIQQRPRIVIASPPCEPFTSANQNRLANPIDRIQMDPKGRLVLHAIRLIGDLEPEFFVIENVVPLKDGKAKDYLRQELKEVGYEHVHFNVLRATEFGLPSERRRLFISNVLLSREREPSSNGNDFQVVADVLDDLPDVHEIHDVPNHHHVPPPAKYEHKIPRLISGQALAYFRSATGRTYLNYIRLHPEKPAPTIQGLSRFIHPWKDRLCSPREHARLMTFPDSHVFIGTSNKVLFNQIGEAVPPSLAQIIARQIKERI